MKTATTIHGTGKLISTNYRLKNDQWGWVKATSFTDQDFKVKIPADTKVNLIKHSEGEYSFFVIRRMKDFGFEIFKDKKVRFESELLKKTTIPKER